MSIWTATGCARYGERPASKLIDLTNPATIRRLSLNTFTAAQPLQVDSNSCFAVVVNYGHEPADRLGLMMSSDQSSRGFGSRWNIRDGSVWTSDRRPEPPQSSWGDGNRVISMRITGSPLGDFVPPEPPVPEPPEPPEPPTPDPEPEMRIRDATTNEANDAQFIVRLTKPADEAVTVTHTTVDGTAVAGEDYTATSGTLTIPAPELMGMITVPLLNDDLDELDETFEVMLRDPVGVVLVDGSAVGTIEDNDPAPKLRISDATVTEADGAEATFAVTLSAESTQTVTVKYRTVNGTAKHGKDYTRTREDTLTFQPGETEKTIVVPVLNDADEEVTESFRVALRRPGNATLADRSGWCTITDNDPEPDQASMRAEPESDHEPQRPVPTLPFFASVVMALLLAASRAIADGWSVGMRWNGRS